MWCLACGDGRLSSRRYYARAGHSLVRIQEWLPFASLQRLGGKQAQNNAHISSHSGTHVGIPCSLSPSDLPAMTVYVHTAGRCCLYRAAVQLIHQYADYPTHCCARPGEKYNCECIQVTIRCNTSKCKRACHQFSTKCLGLLRFLEPSRRFAPLRLPSC